MMKAALNFSGGTLTLTEVTPQVCAVIAEALAQYSKDSTYRAVTFDAQGAHYLAQQARAAATIAGTLAASVVDPDLV
jgi:hypothetical protein